MMGEIARSIIPGTVKRNLHLIAVDNINLTIGSDLPTSVYTSEVGDFYVNWGGYFKSDIDDVRLYNTALTVSQIDSVYTYEKDNVAEDR